MKDFMTKLLDPMKEAREQFEREKKIKQVNRKKMLTKAKRKR